MRENRVMFGVSIIVILMVTMPYIYAFQAAGSNHIFGGFLLNPIDGQSYLAKMKLGFQGEWKFNLPYTAEKGEGAYLFLFYILLGHLARMLNVKLILMFHIARIFGAIFLLWSSTNFIKQIFSESWQRVNWFIISILGAGLGWVAILFGLFTSDFWVAEAYPFLSMYANPHFAFGLGLMLFVLLPGRKLSLLEHLTLGVVLGIIQPFSVVIIVIVFFVRAVHEMISMPGTLKQRIGTSQFIQGVLAFCVGGGIVLGYQFIAIQRDHLLSIWNAQNITPSPLPFDLFLSLSPCLMLAGLGLKSAWHAEKGKLLVFWAGISLCLIFIPWNLQRRFLTGLYVPISGLAIFGLDHVLEFTKSRRKIASILLILLVIPTNMIVIFSGLEATNRKDESIFWDMYLSEAFDWIEDNTQNDSVFLADEKTGLYIPPQTGRRVVYGHPFETTEAAYQLDFVQAILEGKYPVDNIRDELTVRGVDFVVARTDLKNIIQDMTEGKFPVVYKNSGVIIYMVK